MDGGIFTSSRERDDRKVPATLLATPTRARPPAELPGQPARVDVEAKALRVQPLGSSCEAQGVYPSSSEAVLLLQSHMKERQRFIHVSK